MGVLVTGSSGFIGSHIANHFFDPILCDVFNTLGTIPPDDLDTIFDKIDKVYHLGAISSTTEDDSYKISQNNISFSCYLLEECVNRQIPFVYASSASVYGMGIHGFAENVRTDPMNYYAISKDSFDKFAMQKAKDNPNSKIVGLRYFNVYGKGEDSKKDMASPIYKFKKQAETSKKIEIFEGSHGFVRDFIHVEDVKNITVSATSFSSGLYNVGSGKGRSFYDVADIISSITNSKIIEIPFPDHLVGKYQSYTCSENTKIDKFYSKKRIMLEEGIEEVFS